MMNDIKVTSCGHKSMVLDKGTNINGHCLYGSKRIFFATCNDCGDRVRITKQIIREGNFALSNVLIKDGEQPE